MRIAKTVISTLLTASVPLMSCPHLCSSEYEVSGQEAAFDDAYAKRLDLPTYDEVMHFIDRVENDDLESICDPENLQKVNFFVAQLAQEGLLSEDGKEAAILAEDISDLLYEDASPYTYAYSLGDNTQYTIIPAVYFDGGAHAILCKSWLKKKYEQVKKFVKKHKKAIIIGAAVVVAVAIVVATVGVGTGAGAAVAGGAAAAASDPKDGHDPRHGNDSIEPESNPSSASQESSTATVQGLIQEHITDAKEVIANDVPAATAPIETPEQEKTLWETMRGIGSKIAHETFLAVSSIASGGAELVQNAVDFAKNLSSGFEGAPSLDHLHPKQDFEDRVAAGHDAIDDIFSTDLGHCYTADSHHNFFTENDTVIGIIPIIPGANGSIPITGRVSPTQANNIKGWGIGQPIQNLTVEGNVPKWNTVRQRYWKNREEWAKSNPGKHDYTSRDMERMKEGLAPQKYSHEKGAWESKELHHDPAQRDGGLFDFVEVWPEEHAAIDSYRHAGK